MAYNSTGLVVHDADAHIMETPTWLRDYADPAVRDRLDDLAYEGGNELQQAADLLVAQGDLATRFDRLAARHRSDEYRSVEAEEIMLRKNFAATGSFLAEDRPRALDLLGFASQLVFNTFHNSRLRDWEHSGDARTCDRSGPGAQPGHGRVLFGRSAAAERRCMSRSVTLNTRPTTPAQEAIEMGAAALLVASGCPPGHSPSHVGLDPVWAIAQEAGVPIVFHVGGTGELLDPNYFNNGLPVPPDFHGGEENFRSVDYMAIPVQPAQTLATMIFDGVFERFPDLRVGVIEQGAIWVPSWMRQMESAFDAFARHEERLRRPVDATERLRPPPDEVHAVSDRGRRLDHRPSRCGDGVVLQSDYPHVEGGRRPIERFERSIDGRSDAVRQAFYHDNFVDLMGGRVPAAA